MGEQSIGVASDIAVDRLAAISSVGDASREAVVVLMIVFFGKHIYRSRTP